MQARPWYIVRAPSFAGGVAIAMVVIILLTYDLIKRSPRATIHATLHNRVALFLVLFSC